MSESDKKNGPRLSVRIETEDERSLSDAEKKYYWRDRSAIVKTALRLGLQCLEEDPTPLGPPPVRILPSAQFHHSEPVEGTPGEKTLADEMRADQAPLAPTDETERQPGGPSTRMDGTPRRRRGSKGSGKSMDGPDTDEEKRAKR